MRLCPNKFHGDSPLKFVVRISGANLEELSLGDIRPLSLMVKVEITIIWPDRLLSEFSAPPTALSEIATNEATATIVTVPATSRTRLFRLSLEHYLLQPAGLLGQIAHLDPNPRFELLAALSHSEETSFSYHRLLVLSYLLSILFLFYRLANNPDNQAISPVSSQRCFIRFRTPGAAQHFIEFLQFQQQQNPQSPYTTEASLLYEKRVHDSHTGTSPALSSHLSSTGTKGSTICSRISPFAPSPLLAARQQSQLVGVTARLLTEADEASYCRVISASRCNARERRRANQQARRHSRRQANGIIESREDGGRKLGESGSVQIKVPGVIKEITKVSSRPSNMNGPCGACKDAVKISLPRPKRPSLGGFNYVSQHPKPFAEKPKHIVFPDD
ncbi:unnamed protein product [Protopolystoma xenopodis]|uniref:Uncharacterized protein n=1 Tax=Protopolystoma xenopodis TaxID=117903 RepID=A0A448WCH0_9PLAT|nr:unnamed protein product [Protopolystoma xenopodis]